MERARGLVGHLPSCRLPDEGSCCTHILLLPSAWLIVGPTAGLSSEWCVCVETLVCSLLAVLVLPGLMLSYQSKTQSNMKRVVFQPGPSLESQQNDKQDR